ncbi:MAG: hypothetical protein AB7U79_08435 [Candidatus Izemoplasmatales bacterium]
MFNLVKKEWRESIFSMKALFWMFGITLILSGMSLSFISVKELGLMAQSEILVTMVKIIVGIALLITILLSSISLSVEREQATLESIMLTPTSKKTIILSKFVNSLLIWFVIFLITIPYIVALGYGSGLIWTTLLVIFVLGTLIVSLFSILSLSISILVTSSKNGIILSILFLLLSAIPLFLSTTMKATGIGKVIDTVSPLSNLISLSKDVLIRHIALSGLWIYILPMLLLLAIVTVGFFYSISKLSFEEGR